MRGVSLGTCAAQGGASPLSCLGEDPGAAEPWPSLYSYHILILFQQIVATNLPPEDQDGSGDDSDNFSGSGAGEVVMGAPHPRQQQVMPGGSGQTVSCVY